jgi:excinuclease ABC subunit A
LKEEVCSACKGQRLKSESLKVCIDDKNIVELTALSIEDAVPFFEKLSFSKEHQKVTEPILKEIRQRLRFLLDVGLGYLSLDRNVTTLAGGGAAKNSFSGTDWCRIDGGFSTFWTNPVLVCTLAIT